MYLSAREEEEGHHARVPGDLQVFRGMFLWIVTSLWRGREPWGGTWQVNRGYIWGEEAQ